MERIKKHLTCSTVAFQDKEDPTASQLCSLDKDPGPCSGAIKRYGTGRLYSNDVDHIGSNADPGSASASKWFRIQGVIICLKEI